MEHYLPEKNRSFPFFNHSLKKSKREGRVLQSETKTKRSQKNKKQLYIEIWKYVLSRPNILLHMSIVTIAISVVGYNLKSYIFTQDAYAGDEMTYLEEEQSPLSQKSSILLDLLNKKFQENFDQMVVEEANTSSNMYYEQISKEDATLAFAGNMVALGDSNVQAVDPVVEAKENRDDSPFEQASKVVAEQEKAQEQEAVYATNEPLPDISETQASTGAAATPSNTPDQIQEPDNSTAAPTSAPIDEEPVASILTSAGAVEKPSSPIPKEAPKNQEFLYYTVKEGDTLSGIAAAYGRSEKTLLIESGLRRGEFEELKAGTTITILPGNGVSHRVNPGDTIQKIASAYGGNEDAIMKDNDLLGDEDLEVGQILYVEGGTKYIPEKPKEVPVIDATTGSRSGSRVALAAPDRPAKANPTPARSPRVKSNKFPWGWCTYYAAQRFPVGWRGNAGTWLTGARNAGYATGSTPQVGGLVITSESGYGHVAVIESISGNNITVTEMNFRGFGVVSSRTIPSNARQIKGYIYRP